MATKFPAAGKEERSVGGGGCPHQLGGITWQEPNSKIGQVNSWGVRPALLMVLQPYPHLHSWYPHPPNALELFLFPTHPRSQTPLEQDDGPEVLPKPHHTHTETERGKDTETYRETQRHREAESQPGEPAQGLVHLRQALYSDLQYLHLGNVPAQSPRIQPTEPQEGSLNKPIALQMKKLRLREVICPSHKEKPHSLGWMGVSGTTAQVPIYPQCRGF